MKFTVEQKAGIDRVMRHCYLAQNDPALVDLKLCAVGVHPGAVYALDCIDRWGSHKYYLAKEADGKVVAKEHKNIGAEEIAEFSKKN